MYSLIAAVVAEMQGGEDPIIKEGWERGCPKSRNERALIEIWCTLTSKVDSLHQQRMSVVEKRLAEVTAELTTTSRDLRKAQKELRECDRRQVGLGVSAFIDRQGDALPTEEATRLLSDTAAG